MRTAILAALVCVQAAFSQIILSNFTSQSVRDNRWTTTRVDSLLVDSKVGNGIITSLVTLVLTPEKNYDYSRTGQVLDSIEMRSWFTLPSDFVATNMYLWVNGVRQTAYIQDRSLAWEQYSQIVGVRKDPALLEFSGNGSYSLRIFPSKSGQSRKIAIEFQHTMDDDTINLITGCIPLMFDSMNTYSYVQPRNSSKLLGFASVQFTATDNKQYNFSMPGLGEGKLSNGMPLTLAKSNIDKLEPGTIYTTDPSSGSEYLWAGLDKNLASTTGFSAMLSEASIVREPEPQTRIIVLDIKRQYWDWNEYYNLSNGYQGYSYRYQPIDSLKNDVLIRAKKYAILCLKQYVGENKKFNIVLTLPGATQPSALFSSPVYPTSENIQAAFQAIRSLKANPQSSTSAALFMALDQSPKSAVIMISDLYQPYNYGKWVENQNQYIISSDGKEYDSLVNLLSERVKASGSWLFTISDDWRLYSIAYESGGYQLASLRYDQYYNYEKCTLADGSVEYRPTILPALFDQRYNQGFSGLKVTSNQLSDITWSIDGYYYSWWRWPVMNRGVVMMKQGAMAKSQLLAKMSNPYSYNNGGTMLRVAGKTGLHAGSKNFEFTITGKFGGLGFTKTVSGRIPSLFSMATNGNEAVQWAFLKSEWYAATDWQKYSDSIKAIGLGYHITTRQTSLLALEPGMVLKEDTLWANQSSTDSRKSGGVTTSNMTIQSSADMMYPSSTDSTGTQSLDGVSLDDLINGATPVKPPSPAKTNSVIRVGTYKSDIIIRLPADMIGKSIRLSIFDARGRLIAKKTPLAQEAASGKLVWGLGSGYGKIAKGCYQLIVESGKNVKHFSVTLF